MKRTVNTTLKSNMKCEHCRYWVRDFIGKCTVKNKYTYYYQTCKEFDWTDEIKEQTNVDKNTEQTKDH